ncbi:MAG: anthranilate synthase component I family protein [Planctomycetota bacterium]|nr:anthranilate synthase component I family protein [Planctomycetota bacterium]
MTSSEMLNPFLSPLQREELDPIDLNSILDAMRSHREGFLFESGLDVAGCGGWHFCAVDPLCSFEATRDRWSATDASGTLCGGDQDPLTALEMWWQRWSIESSREEFRAGAAEIPFTGGAVGWIGYEAADRFLGLSVVDRSQDPITGFLEGIPEMYWRLYDEVVAIDANQRKGWFLHRGRAGWQQRRWWLSGDRREQRRRAPVRIEAASLSDQEYLGAVEEIRKQIGVGEVYEVNMARGLLVEGIPSAPDLHRLWRTAQPVPYGALIQGDPVSIVSASPEQFLRRRGEHIVTRPIKGTVPRHGDAKLDRESSRRLLEDEKERAELAMIVDLERNDLGRICQTGSVAVKCAAEVEEYASVFHTVATVEGRLRGDPGPGEILRATFPGGSITGAPKIAAMEQIRRLEPWPRSVYTGSVGWIAPDGDLELSIAIRTALVKDGRALIPFGGAVTWDSEPSSERAELTHKARAMFEALGL